MEVYWLSLPPNRDNVLEVLLAQYHQCYEDLRQHNRFVWEIPSIVVVLNGALIGVAFGNILAQSSSRIYARPVLMLIGVTITTALLVALVKHRYFSYVEQQTLTEIESVLRRHAGNKLKHVQRATKPKYEESLYYATLEPSNNEPMKPLTCLTKLQSPSAHVGLIGSVCVILGLMIALAVVSPFLP